MGQPPALEAGAARGQRHCDLPRGTRGKAQWQQAFEVAHLAAGGSQLKDASGGPAGGQTFEKFDKQVLKNTLG